MQEIYERLLKSQKKIIVNKIIVKQKIKEALQLNNSTFFLVKLNSVKDSLLPPLLVETQWPLRQFI